MLCTADRIFGGGGGTLSSSPHPLLVLYKKLFSIQMTAGQKETGHYKM